MNPVESLIHAFLAPMQLGVAESSDSYFFTARSVRRSDGASASCALHRRHPAPQALRPVAWLKFAPHRGRASKVRRPLTHLVDLLPWLRPRVHLRAPEALRCEAHRLIQWQVHGLPAPRLMALGDDFLITADAGPTLIQWIAAEPLARRRLALLKHAAQALGRIHAAGVIHGNPRLRHIAYDGEKITFLHLEEFSGVRLPLAVAQACDALRFFVSAAGALRTAAPGALRVVWAAYLHGAPPPSTERTIRCGFRLLSCWSRAMSLVPGHWLRRDLARASQVLRRVAWPT